MRQVLVPAYGLEEKVETGFPCKILGVLSMDDMVLVFITWNADTAQHVNVHKHALIYILVILLTYQVG